MIILDREEMRRAVMRLSMELLEKNKGTDGLVLVGVSPRGAVLAKKMRREIERIEGVSLPIGFLGVSRDGKKTEESDIGFSLDGKNVALVDDIMYTGRTVREAVTALTELGKPKTIRLYTLIDRGHRELPFRPDGVGKNVPTSSEERVKVHFAETDGEEAVILEK